MKNTLLETYALLVCFVTLICFTVTLGLSLYNVVRINNPAFTLNAFEYQTYQTNDAFCMNRAADCKGKDNAAIAQKRQEAFTVAINNERRNGMQSLVTQLIIILIDMGVFIPHWIIARRARS